MDAVELWAASICSSNYLIFQVMAQMVSTAPSDCNPSQQLGLNTTKWAESITETWVQIYASQSLFKQGSWHEEHPLAGSWLAAAWQDLPVTFMKPDPASTC